MTPLRPAIAWSFLSIMVLLAGCGPSSESPDYLAPPGVDPNAASVDGLSVGHNFMRSGEYELALKAYQRSVVELGLTPDVLNAIAVANLKLGRTGEAERLLRNAVEQNRDFGPAWNNLGVLLAEKRQFREAKRAFEIAFGLAEGRSTQIKNNIAKIVATLEEIEYKEPNKESDFELVRRGDGVYLLLETPN
ncbi:MAG: tetratricopeptide repeat protein [Pseudomonadota bacterium]